MPVQLPREADDPRTEDDLCSSWGWLSTTAVLRSVRCPQMWVPVSGSRSPPRQLV